MRTQKVWYTFNVDHPKGPYPVGGELATLVDAKRERGDFIYRCDKRKKIPQTAILKHSEIVEVVEVVEAHKYKDPQKCPKK